MPIPDVPMPFSEGGAMREAVHALATCGQSPLTQIYIQSSCELGRLPPAWQQYRYLLICDNMFHPEHNINQQSRLEDICVRYYPVLTAILTHLSGSDAALLLAVIGLYYNVEWAGVKIKFVCLQRDVPEHSQWIDTMVLNGHKALFVGNDLDAWAARLRYPLTCKRYSTLRVWLAVRVRYGVDAELNKRRRARPWAYFLVTREGGIVWGPSRSARQLRGAFWTDNNVIPIPHNTSVPEPIIPRVSWSRTDIPNKNGIELVWAQSTSAGRLPFIKMCPTQWSDQGQDRGQEGWHRTTLAWREECDRIAPGAAPTTKDYRGQSAFRMPYFDLSTLEYSETVHLRDITHPDRFAFIIELECTPGPTNVANKLHGILW